MSDSDILLIGVDGGATEAKAHAVSCEDPQRAVGFGLRPESAARVYSRVPGFEPVPLAEQLAQRDAGNIQFAETERQQGNRYIAATAEAVVEVARACGAVRILVGVGMPGLKTADRRGINVINNGPRMPDYLDRLERRLADAGLELAAPIAALGSDADYCGLGEEHAAAGLFHDVEHAYYLGCGTGIADAMKLRGRLVPFDEAKTWIHKSWQMASALGPTFEKLVSASSLNRVYVNLEGHGRSTGDGAFPEAAAAAGRSVAAVWMATAALVVAELIFERVWTIRNGRADCPHRGTGYAALDPNHAYRGVVLDRVVLGQRLGQIYADRRYRALFGDRLDACLAHFIATSGDAALAQACLADQAAPRGERALRPGFVQPSRLRAAPALGAAVAALCATR